jgi:hypothetical protein
LVDFRSPAFDLDNVYGRGSADQPYLYDDGDSFLLGDALHGGSDPQARDLPRNSAAVRRALIGDPRNDENALVSQSATNRSPRPIRCRWCSRRFSAAREVSACRCSYCTRTRSTERRALHPH